MTMKSLGSYLFIVLIIIAIISIAIVYILKFCSKNKSEQINKIKEWLLYAVTAAEKELGCNTGKIKLRYVYNLFISQFPSAIVDKISFEYFSTLVDEVLQEFKSLITSNPELKSYVYTKEEE